MVLCASWTTLNGTDLDNWSSGREWSWLVDLSSCGVKTCSLAFLKGYQALFAITCMCVHVYVYVCVYVRACVRACVCVCVCVVYMHALGAWTGVRVYVHVHVGMPWVVQMEMVRLHEHRHTHYFTVLSASLLLSDSLTVTKAKDCFH